MVTGQIPYGKEKYPQTEKNKSNAITVISGMMTHGKKISHIKMMCQGGVMRTKRFNCPR